jgi:16S rRNA (cytosine1402-N4)-methyltransferase
MTVHIPVLAEEIIQWLSPQPGSVIADCTAGGGGHTRLIAQQVLDHGRVIAMDRDPGAVANLEQQLSGLPVSLVNANFCDLPEVLQQLEIDSIDGILLDLGLSSDQLADRSRGFSYESDGVLDLRFDPSEGKPAWKFLERVSEKHLADLIYQFGEERMSRRVARAIVKRRHSNPIRTAQELAELVRSVVPRSKNHSIDPATRTFQALRIAVNEELKWVEVALKRLPGCLKPGGRIAVISFHSLEDRLVKNYFREDPRLNVLTPKPIRPTDYEIINNSRSRSSRLRVAERIQSA